MSSECRLLTEQLYQGYGYSGHDYGSYDAYDEAVSHASKDEGGSIVVEKYAVQPVYQRVAYGGQGGCYGAYHIQHPSVLLRTLALLFHCQGEKTYAKASEGGRYEVKNSGIGDAGSKQLFTEFSYQSCKYCIHRAEEQGHDHGGQGCKGNAYSSYVDCKIQGHGYIHGCT